jgi:acyl-homoserine lactone acylase PvdQ
VRAQRPLGLDAALSGMAGIGRSGHPTANWEAAPAQAVAAPTAAQLVPLFPGTGPDGNGMPVAFKSQAQWLTTIQLNGCGNCH